MKAPLNWLRDYVDITLPPAELAERLTMAGFEVGEIQEIGSDWKNIVVGQIAAVNPHPNADRLRLATVDLGTEQETVVCGAPNLNIGDKVPFARVGARLLNPHNGELEELKTAKIRGVVSSGMICSEKELGISDSHEGIMVLSPEAPLATPLADTLGDTVFDLDITPNRPDCLSIVGIAREVAALSGGELHIPEISYEETSAPIDEQISIEIADPDLCPRYCASLITGITIDESPSWLQERLLACGMRPINNIVDITNYIMLEYGQPLHSFDYERIKGKKIVVRRAEDNEYLISLDEADRVLSRDMLVIADGERAVAIAGVMGGLNSEITWGTTSILLEAASFNPASIHYTSHNLSLTSEASMRFERGISAGVTIPALRHATQLIMQLGGGKVAKGIVDVYPGKREPEAILLTPEDVKRILGIELSLDQIVISLISLGFGCKVEDSKISVTVPYWRSDVRQTVDLIEEVARIIGYDKIPTTLLSEPLPHYIPDPIVRLKKRIRQSMVGYGFQEVITFSLAGLEMLSKLTPEPTPPEPMPLRVANPMNAEQEYLRPNLRANLLTTLSANRRHEDGGIKLFELDKIYLRREQDLPSEPEVLCGILSGDRTEISWRGGDGSFDFYDAKGIAESLFRLLDVAVNFEQGNDKSLHPTRQSKIFGEADGKRVDLGTIGELHPKVADNFEITEPVCLFEINVTALLPFATVHKIFQSMSRFPSTTRDLALIAATTVTHQEVQNIIRGYSLVSEVTLFDIYSGNQVANGKKSLAYRVVYQSPTHTLTDEEVNKVQNQILDKLSKELGATLRG
ncbi:phenylalanine--tRNA ligase subunit beta [Chloroflexota bacterium]